MNNYSYNDHKYSTTNMAIRELEKEFSEKSKSKSVKVLDVGCNEGYLGERFSDSFVVYGIERDIEAAKVAKKTYKKVFNTDLNQLEEINSTLKGHSFNAIVCLDVLEHILYPLEALNLLLEHLNKGGILIVSLPNVAHWKIRLKLLFGSFNYTDSGILDKTHLHLYTKSSGRKLIKKSNAILEKTKFASSKFTWFINRPVFSIFGTLLGINLFYIGRKS